MLHSDFLGIPTEYGFALPRLRHTLSVAHIQARTETLLDFGCGNGANTILFAPDARTVVGVDVDGAYVAFATAAAQERGLDNLRYRTYDGHTLPLADGSIDHAVSFEVLEHTADHDRALDELARVLKPGGMLTLSVPNKWYLMETHGFELRPTWIPWNRIPLLSWLPTRLHERWAKARIYSRRRILHLLAEHGFDVVEHRYIMPPFDRLKRQSLRPLLTGVFAAIERTPLRAVGVAHFVAARRRP